MLRCAIVLVALVAAPAHAEEPDAPAADPASTDADRLVALTLSGAGGADFPSNQIWAGVELKARSAQRRGLAPMGSLTPAYSVSDNTALVWAEAGATAAFGAPDAPDATIRVGLVGRVQVPFVRWPLPVRVGEVDQIGFGLVPAGQLLLEMAWEDRPGVEGSITVRAGVGSEAFLAPCGGRPSTACQTWLPGFVGSVGGRLDWPDGLHIEATAGTTNRLAIGKGF
jgi:hypothetical protein